MRRIIFFIIFGFVFGSAVFGQQPGNAPAPVEFAPLINWDDVFDGITSWFTDILKEYWVLLLSIFFVWVAFMTMLSFLQGRAERCKAEARLSKAVECQEAMEEASVAGHVPRVELQRQVDGAMEIDSYGDSDLEHDSVHRRGVLCGGC